MIKLSENIYFTGVCRRQTSDRRAAPKNDGHLEYTENKLTAAGVKELYCSVG